MKYSPTHEAPVATPANKRPINNIVTFDASAKEIQLMMYGIAMQIVAHFLPIFSAKIPAGNAPTKAPTARKEPTHGTENK